MFFLQMRMHILILLMFSILFGVITAIAHGLGVGNTAVYFLITLTTIFLQYMFGPTLIEWFMKVRYVNKDEYPELFAMVSESAQKAKIPMPRVAVSRMDMPNAFAYGRWLSDGRVCVTQGILKLLTAEELKAVIGHEIAHIKNRDVLTITLLSVIPLLLYRIAFNILFYGGGRDRKGNQNILIVGIISLVLYFITNLLVLYGSRIREYFADRGSVSMGNDPKFLAQALYKLTQGSTRAAPEDLKKVEGVKAFFINNPSLAKKEIQDLGQIGFDRSGQISQERLRYLKNTPLRLNPGDEFKEIFSTHPNMVKRIKQLSNYVN